MYASPVDAGSMMLDPRSTQSTMAASSSAGGVADEVIAAKPVMNWTVRCQHAVSVRLASFARPPVAVKLIRRVCPACRSWS